MVLKLSDDFPVVWRTPTSLQIGVDAPHVVLDDVGAGDERLITALRRGISVSGWTMLARDAGVTGERAQALLDAVQPVLETPIPVPTERVLITGDNAIAHRLADLLRDTGSLALATDQRPTLVVLVASWVIGPEDSQRWLRRDVPHLPVVASDRSVAVGPFVEPGRGPCLYCAHLTRTDADTTWPAVATQLWGRPPPRMSALTVAAAASFVGRCVLGRLQSGSGSARTWRLSSAGGTVSVATQVRHPDCSCSAPLESDWAPGAGRAHPEPPTRATVDSGPE